MDQIHDVETFRTMLSQKGILSPDGRETALGDLLCSDASAVRYFFDNYLTTEKPLGDEYYRRMAYSSLERSEMFTKDLMLLAFWGQYLESIRVTFGLDASLERVSHLGFGGFSRLDYQEIREMISCVRSNATALLWHLRETSAQIGRKSPKKLGKLLARDVS